jgi:hypothetical protein
VGETKLKSNRSISCTRKLDLLQCFFPARTVRKMIVAIQSWNKESTGVDHPANRSDRNSPSATVWLLHGSGLWVNDPNFFGTVCEVQLRFEIESGRCIRV